MAVNHSTKCHAAQFVSTLSVSQRNALRVILTQEHGCANMRRALGTQALKTISEHDRRTGMARAGRTAELFTQHHVAANIRIGWIRKDSLRAGRSCPAFSFCRESSAPSRNRNQVGGQSREYVAGSHGRSRD